MIISSRDTSCGTGTCTDDEAVLRMGVNQAMIGKIIHNMGDDIRRGPSTKTWSMEGKIQEPCKAGWPCRVDEWIVIDYSYSHSHMVQRP